MKHAKYIVELLEGHDVIDSMEIMAGSWLDARKLAVLEASHDVRRPKWPSDPLHRDIRATTVAQRARGR